MFEPFHPRHVKQAKEISPHLYVRPDDLKNPANKVAAEIFSGKLINRRVDSNNKLRWKYDGLLVKDIFANLFAFWAAERFPNIKIILLMRNPFAVALSKYRMKNAFWMTDPKDFFKQPTLLEDFLKPFEDLILDAGEDFIERQILIWSIIHYVPLRQFAGRNINTVFYEDVFNQPKDEMKKIFDFIEPGKNHENNSGWLEEFDRPSRVAGNNSNVVKGKSPITAWKNQLSVNQIERGNKILRRFGFEDLYDFDGKPNRMILEKRFFDSKENIKITEKYSQTATAKIGL